MKKGLTELVFILDKSGSMADLKKDTIGGFNSMLAKQRKVEGECFVTTVLFDNYYELLHDRIDIRAIEPITEKEYYVGGSTALLDAIGKTINKIGKTQLVTKEEYRAEKVLFVIITDGEENSSREFSSSDIKKLITNQKKEYNWEFIFLGANIDTVETAERYGIDRNRAQSYRADSKGVGLNFETMSEVVCHYRQKGDLPEDWNKKIKKDYNQRNKKNLKRVKK